MDIKTLVNGGIASLKPYVAGKPIEDVKRELGLTDIVKLASNENPFGPSQKVIDACKKAIDECNFYPDSNAYYLKEKLKEKFNYNPNCITIGAGSNELINLIFQCFVNKDVNVVIPEYSFIVYPMEAVVNGANIKYAKLDNYYTSCKNLLDLIDDKTRLIVIANPSNPIGTSLDFNSIKDFLSKVPEHILVVIDEAYNEFNLENTTDTYTLLKDHPNLMISRTFSKAYGLAGLRIGYLLASEQISSILNALRAPFNVNQIAINAAICALDDEEHLKKVVQSNHEQLQRYIAFAKEHNFKYIQSYANFITIDFNEDGQKIFESLLKQGVIVRALKNYGLDTMVRISIGTKEQNDKFFEAFEKIK